MRLSSSRLMFMFTERLCALQFICVQGRINTHKRKEVYK